MHLLLWKQFCVVQEYTSEFGANASVSLKVSVSRNVIAGVLSLHIFCQKSYLEDRRTCRHSRSVLQGTIVHNERRSTRLLCTSYKVHLHFAQKRAEGKRRPCDNQSLYIKYIKVPLCGICVMIMYSLRVYKVILCPLEIGVSESWQLKNLSICLPSWKMHCLFA